MIFLSRNKSLFVFYFAVVKPFFVFSQANMSSIIDPGKFSVAYVTVPNAGVGKTLGNEIIKNKLAACVNIIPQVTSIYEWKGQITEDNESLLMIKTTTKLVDKLTVFIRSKHPYEVCEVIALPIRNGNPPYLKWIEDTVQEE